MTVGISQTPHVPRSEVRRTGDTPGSFSMRVSSKAHYGLRMMTEFAKAYGQGPLSIAEVARVEQLPLAYLEQLAGQLRRGGLVESTRGVHGGYSLTRAPERISVLEVVRTVEGEISPVECVSTGYVAGNCAREGECASRGLWQRLKQSIELVLSDTSLAELIHDRSLLDAMAPDHTVEDHAHV
jgi:Rrf2 family cysteine metabolism transcriptional repressor